MHLPEQEYFSISFPSAQVRKCYMIVLTDGKAVNMTSIEMRHNPLFTREMSSTVGKWNIPALHKEAIPQGNIQLIACSDTRSGDVLNKDKGVHFFVDDYRFESIYRNPENSFQKFAQYRFVLTPDYSLYADMPMWRQIESVGKNRWCGAWWQERGLIVIPTVSWSNYPSYDFCFDGIEEGSCVAVGMIGCKGNKSAFMHGYDAMIERIKPEAIICFGVPFKEMRGNVVPIDYLASRKVVR